MQNFVRFFLCYWHSVNSVDNCIGMAKFELQILHKFYDGMLIFYFPPRDTIKNITHDILNVHYWRIVDDICVRIDINFRLDCHLTNEKISKRDEGEGTLRRRRRRKKRA